MDGLWRQYYVCTYKDDTEMVFTLFIITQVYFRVSYQNEKKCNTTIKIIEFLTYM